MGRREKTIHVEQGENPSQSVRMRLARRAKNITLTEMAEQLQYSKSYLSTVENGTVQPTFQLLQKYEMFLGLEQGELTDNPTLEPVEASSREEGEEVAKIALQYNTKIDWGDAPLVNAQELLGRHAQQNILETWMKQKSTHLVLILGLGGIGKTTLASFVTDSVKGHFEFVYWRSLHNAPSATYVLRDCLQFLLQGEPTDIPDTFNAQVLLLIKCLREHRCLVVFDNLEAILSNEEASDATLNDDNGYAPILRAIGEGRHQSCLLLTSREKPKVIAHLEAKTMPVYTLPLTGLEKDAAQLLLEQKMLVGTSEAKSGLIDYYAGNPLALKLVSEFIREFFSGDIDEFFYENELHELMIGDVADLLQQHFTRLTTIECLLMYWLAIEREEVPSTTLNQDLLHPISKSLLLQSISSLLRRCMIEKNDGAYYLQPVIREYVTKRILDEIIHDFEKQTITTLDTYALMKAQARESVRLSQVDFLLRPLESHFLKKLGPTGYRALLQQTLTLLHQDDLLSGYAAGNILNLLAHSNLDTNAFDFSRFTIRSAYLQGVNLPGINFSSSAFKNSVFTETFGNILSVSFSPNGHYLIAGTANGTICLWDRDKKELLRVYHGHQNWVRSVVFSSDGVHFASGSDDETIHLWSIEHEHSLQEFIGHEQRVRCVLFAPDGTTLLSSSDDTTIRFWNIADATCLRILRGHTHRVRSLALSPDGQILASGSDDCTIRLWQFTDTTYFKILSGHTHRVRSVAFSPDGNLLASCSDDQSVRIWKVSSSVCLQVLLGHKHLVRSAIFSSDGATIASCSEDHDIRLWNVQTTQCRVLTGHTNAVRSLAFHPLRNILVSGGDDQAIRFWNTENGQCQQTIQGHSSWIYSVNFSPDGSLLASGSQDHNIRLWQADTGERLHTLAAHKGLIYAVAFSPDGKFLASCSQDREIKIWNMQTLQCLTTLRGHKDQVNAVAFSPDGQFLASGGEDNLIIIWQTATGTRHNTLSGHSHRVRSVAFHPSGTLLASASEDKTLKLWQLQTGQCLQTLTGHTDQVRSVAFSLDGTLLVSGSEDATLRLWEVATGTCKHVLRGHTHRIRAAVFSSDSTLLMSGSEDGTVRFWHTSTGEQLTTVLHHKGLVYTVAFSPDNTIVASGSYDGTIKLWQLKTGKCVHTLLSERPYEGMKITTSTGFTQYQREMLLHLGAIE